MGRAGEQLATTNKSPTELLPPRGVVHLTEVDTRFLANLTNCPLLSVFGAPHRTPLAVIFPVTDMPRLVSNVQLLCLREGYKHSDKSIPDV